MLFSFIRFMKGQTMFVFYSFVLWLFVLGKYWHKMTMCFESDIIDKVSLMVYLIDYDLLFPSLFDRCTDFIEASSSTYFAPSTLHLWRYPRDGKDLLKIIYT